MPSRSRRTVLALSASALLPITGCLVADSDPKSATSVSPSTGTTKRTTDETTSGELTSDETTDHSNYRQVQMTVTSADPADVADAVVRQFSDLTGRQRRVVSNSVTDGEYVYTTYVEKPLEDGTYVAYEGAYYRVGVEVAAERQRTAHLFHLDAISDCGHLHDEEELETAREEAIQFEDLPEADREAFVFTHEDYFREDACFSSGYHYVYESESAAETSVLVSDDPTYVEYRDDTYVVEFQKTMPITEYDYRYSTERVARTEAQLHDVMARDMAIHLRPNDLSVDERELLDELTNVPTHEEWENPIPDRVDALLERFRSYETHGEWDLYFVEYRGEYYEFRIQEAVA